MKMLAVVMLAAASLAAGAQEPEVVDQREFWSIGAAAFEGRNLSPENVYLTRSFPLLLRERLEAVPSHFFSESEIRAYRERIIRREIQRLAEAVSADRRARDELFFTSGLEGASVYEQRIADNLAAIQQLRELDPATISVPQSKPLRFVTPAEGELIFDKPLLSPLELALQEDLDALLWGSFEEIQGFLYFEVRVFDAIRAEQVFSYSDAATPTELYDLVDGLVGELATALLGREWSSLRVVTVPPQASVWIDDSFQGRTPVRIPYLLPGRKTLRLDAPGYETVVESIELSPYSEEVRDIALSPQPRDTFSLDSDPEGAAVYEGAEWIGSTPLSVSKPEDLRRFLLRQEGYLDFPFYADPAVQDSLTASLLPGTIDLQAIQERRRDELYGAFGAFALSIPVPFFLLGYRYDYLVLGAQSASAEAARTSDTLFYLSLGAVAVSAGLFANMMIRLVRYLQVADRRA